MDQPETYPTPAYASGSSNVVLRADDGRSIEVDALSFDDLIGLAAITRRSVRDVFGTAVEHERSSALTRPKQPAASSGDGAVKRPGRPAKAAS